MDDKNRYYPILDDLLVSLRSNQYVKMESSAIYPPKRKKPDILINFPHLNAFYKEVDGFKLSWKLKRKRNPDYSGETNIITCNAMTDGATAISLGSQDFWKINNEKKNINGEFFPIHLIESDACVGLFSDFKNFGEGIYYNEFGINFYLIANNWYNYISLLQKSYAIRYWQKAILLWEYGEMSKNVDIFEEILHKISPEFTLDDFKAYYLNLK